MDSKLTVVPMAASRAYESIPSAPGVYAFYLSFISRRSLGLYDGTKVTPEEISNAKSILERKFNQSLELRKDRQYIGRVRDASRSSHLSPSYQVSLQEQYSATPVAGLIGLEGNLFLNAIDLIEGSVLLQTPVYVGIAVDQTLRDRCFQHRHDYEVSDGSNRQSFGGRLRRAGLEWGDLLFTARPSDAYGAELKKAERAIQLLVNPILSLR